MSPDPPAGLPAWPRWLLATSAEKQRVGGVMVPHMAPCSRAGAPASSLVSLHTGLLPKPPPRPLGPRFPLVASRGGDARSHLTSQNKQAFGVPSGKFLLYVALCSLNTRRNAILSIVSVLMKSQFFTNLR